MNTSSFKEKQEKLSRFQAKHNLPQVPCFVIALLEPLQEKKGAQELIEALSGIIEFPVQVLIRAKSEKQYQTKLEKMAKDCKDQVLLLPDSEENRQEISEVSSVSVFLSEEKESQEMLALSMKNGVVPLVFGFQDLEPFDPIEEKGECFRIHKKTQWHIFASLIRAKENFSFPYDWKNLQKSVKEKAENAE
jgi:hypothetical protein